MLQDLDLETIVFAFVKALDFYLESYRSGTWESSESQGL